MRAWAGALVGLAVALVVPGATASPSAPVRSLAPPSIGGTWTGNGFTAEDTLTISSNGTNVNGSSTKSWVCDQGGWRVFKDGETVATWKGPFRDLFVGTWNGERTFTGYYRYCYTGVFNANLNGVQPPFSQNGDLQGTVSPDGNTITYTYKVPVPCNATDFSYCPIKGSGTLTRVAEKKKLTLEPTTRALPDGHVGAPYRQAFRAAGGSPPYVYTLSSPGVLPALKLDRTTGVLSGRMKRAGEFSFSVAVKDSSGAFARRGYDLYVEGPEGGQLALAVSAVTSRAKVGVRARTLDIDVTILNVGTEKTLPTRVDVTVRSHKRDDIDLFFEKVPTAKGGRSECRLARGSGTPSVHLSCTVPVLAPRASFVLGWVGETDELPDTGGGLETYSFRVSASVGKGSPDDDSSDNSDGETIGVTSR